MTKHRIGFAGQQIRLPRSRALRIAIGITLVVAGFVGFLPVVGFWMIPLGLIVLSVDLPVVRRARRRFVVWWERRRRPRSSRVPAQR
jgi:purine-cytosine permease-like protein